MNVFEYSAREEAKFRALAKNNGYEPISTFFGDLSIAEFCQKYMGDSNAVKSTYKNVCKNWLSDYKMFTEFSLCLNWKIWEHYEIDDELSMLYDSLWKDSVDKFYAKYGVEGENNEEAVSYYWRVTD